MEANSMKCWIVIELAKDREPKIIGVYRSRAAAEAVACTDPTVWRNVIGKPLI